MAPSEDGPAPVPMHQILRTLVALLALAAADARATTHVQYQGHTFALAKSYADFDDYKEDPDNLTDTQARLAASLVRKAAFGPRFRDGRAASDALGRLAFPGYGSFFANQ